MVIYLSKYAILLVMILVLQSMAFIVNSYVSVEYGGQADVLTIQTYLSNFSINLRFGGIIESYKYNGINVMTSRYFGPATIRKAIFYEIIPSATPVTASSNIFWPGEIFQHKASYKVVENTPYKLVIDLRVKISDVYDLFLIKRYTFYYDKPYFDITYIFENNENIQLKMDLSQTWLRATSFSIELASSYGNDAEDDFQIVGTTDNRLMVYQAYSPGTLENLQGKVQFIALISHSSDYTIPQGIILIPQGDTVKKTLGVWFEVAGQGLVNVPQSSIVRLEMKAFTMNPKSNTTFSFRVYMGPIAYNLLTELNLQRIVVHLRTNYVQRIPNSIPEFSVQEKYRLTLSTDLIDRNSYPNATLQVYYVREDGSIELVENISFAEIDLPYTILLDRQGLYTLRIYPETGFSLDQNHIYEKVYVNGKEITETYIPVYRDTSITLSFALKPIAWLTILVVDDNYYPLSEISQNPLYIEVKSETGFFRRYHVSEPLYKTYLPPGEYTISIKPSEIANRKLTDIYLNNIYVLYRTGVNETIITIDLGEASQNTLVLRYSGLGGAGGAGPEMFMVIMLGFIVIAVLLAIILVLILRGRRRRI